MNELESVQLPVRIDAWWKNEQEKQAAGPVGERMREAYAFFKENGFPHPKMEDWKYTQVHRVTDFPYAWPVKDESLLDKKSFASLPLANIEEAYRLVFVNGYLQEDLSLLPQGEEKFSVTHLGAGRGSGHYEAHLGAVVHLDTGFTALNTALHTDG